MIFFGAKGSDAFSVLYTYKQAYIFTQREGKTTKQRQKDDKTSYVVFVAFVA